MVEERIDLEVRITTSTRMFPSTPIADRGSDQREIVTNVFIGKQSKQP